MCIQIHLVVQFPDSTYLCNQPKNHDEPKKTKMTRSPRLNRKKTAFVRYLLLFCVDAVAGACWEHNKLTL